MDTMIKMTNVRFLDSCTHTKKTKQQKKNTLKHTDAESCSLYQQVNIIWTLNLLGTIENLYILLHVDNSEFSQTISRSSEVP